MQTAQRRVAWVAPQQSETVQIYTGAWWLQMVCVPNLEDRSARGCECTPSGGP